MSLKVAFSSIYRTSSNSVTPDAMDKPRSARRSLSFKSRKPQDSSLGASQVQWSIKDDQICLGTRRLGSAKHRYLQVNQLLSTVYISVVQIDHFHMTSQRTLIIYRYTSSVVIIQPGSRVVQLKDVLLLRRIDCLICKAVQDHKIVCCYLTLLTEFAPIYVIK